MDGTRKTQIACNTHIILGCPVMCIYAFCKNIYSTLGTPVHIQVTPGRPNPPFPELIVLSLPLYLKKTLAESHNRWEPYGTYLLLLLVIQVMRRTHCISFCLMFYTITILHLMESLCPCATFLLPFKTELLRASVGGTTLVQWRGKGNSQLVRFLHNVKFHVDFINKIWANVIWNIATTLH